jgi:hypothetical protein
MVGKLQVDVRFTDDGVDLMDVLDAVGDRVPDPELGGASGSFVFEGASVQWELLWASE